MLRIGKLVSSSTVPYQLAERKQEVTLLFKSSERDCSDDQCIMSIIQPTHITHMPFHITTYSHWHNTAEQSETASYEIGEATVLLLLLNIEMYRENIFIHHPSIFYNKLNVGILPIRKGTYSECSRINKSQTS